MIQNKLFTSFVSLRNLCDAEACYSICVNIDSVQNLTTTHPPPFLPSGFWLTEDVNNCSISDYKNHKIL